MKKQLLFIFCSIAFFIVSCNKSDQASKSDFGIPTTEPNVVITPERYSDNSLIFLNAQRKTLQTVLPNSIHDVLLTYKDLLLQVEKSKIYASSAKEQQEYMIQAQTKAFDSLVSKDIDVNISYLNLLADLENLNHQYSKKYNIPLDTFKSYYSIDKIVLSEEVFMKIQELLKEDQLRTKQIQLQEKNDLIADGAVLALNLVPMGGILAKVPSFSKNAITQIHNGVNSASKNKTLQAGAGKIAHLSYDIAKKSGTTKISNVARKKIIAMMSNDTKRIVLGSNLVGSSKRAVNNKIVLPLRNSNSSLISSDDLPKNSSEFFKAIENKLEGRIGDFSDGILSVHLQNVRETIKYNQRLIGNLDIKK